MKTRTLGSTGLEISSVVFGGNVFGWTLDETESFKMLEPASSAEEDMLDLAYGLQSTSRLEIGYTSILHGTLIS